jgi:hypothetical protein
MAKPETIQLAVVSLILATAVIGGWYVVSQKQIDDPIQDRHIMRRGMEMPVIWIYVNNSEVNARSWADFEARSSRVLNLPFLNLCYQTCAKANAGKYRVEVIGGLADLAVRLGGWNALPTPLRNPDAVVNEPELNWIRAAVLARFGGLWASPALIWLKPMGELPKNNVVMFGSDDEVSFVGDGGTQAPSLRVAWSPIPEHPIWVDWERKVRTRLEKRAGGSEFRRDEMTDAVDAIRQAEKRGEPIEVRPMAELTRKGAAGRRIQCEDLLAAGDAADIPFDIRAESIYVPIPWPEMKERRAFGWFLRMSEDQILESDLAVSHLFRSVV